MKNSQLHLLTPYKQPNYLLNTHRSERENKNLLWRPVRVTWGSALCFDWLAKTNCQFLPPKHLHPSLDPGSRGLVGITSWAFSVFACCTWWGLMVVTTCRKSLIFIWSRINVYPGLFLPYFNLHWNRLHSAAANSKAICLSEVFYHKTFLFSVIIIFPYKKNYTWQSKCLCVRQAVMDSLWTLSGNVPFVFLHLLLNYK